MEGDLQTIMAQFPELVTTYGPSFLAALVTLVLGLLGAGLAQRFIRRALDKTGRIEKTISIFAASLVRYVIIAVTVLAVLDRFGVETTSLIALLGAASLAVGLALQGTLSNLAAGVMLLLFRPFRVGDYVEVGGMAGTVESISLFTTHLDSSDNVHLVIPNGSIWGSTIKNFSHNPTRRIEMIIGVGYGDDLDHVLKVTRSVVEEDRRSLQDPEPLFAVNGLGGSSVDIIIRVWCERSDFLALRLDLTKKIKERFEREGISIP